MKADTDAPDNARQVAARYETRRTRFEAAAEAHAGRARTLSRGRLVAFIIALVLGVLAEERGPALLWVGAAAAIVAFIALIALHRRERRRESWQRALAEANRLGTLRLQRAWAELPVLASPDDERTRFAADDLDIFGRPGLTQLFGPVTTPAGRATLYRWLLAPDSPIAIPARQAAVRALAPENDWRDELAAHASGAGDVDADEIASFLNWAQSPPWLASRPWLRWTARLLPVLTIALAGAQIAGVTDRALWLLPLITAGFLSWGRTGREVHATFNRAFAREGVLHHYPALLAHAARVPGDASHLNDLRAALHTRDVDAHEQLGRLERLMRLSELRFSSTLHAPVQVLTMWDFHVLDRLEAWQRAAGRRVHQWLDAAGEVEATAALATMAHDHPDWTFAHIDPQLERLSAQALGHPMLRDDVRVHNDVEVGPAGTFLLVTGSNMSGKSTLLRALGANVVLAQAGAPVCARSMSLPPLLPYTSVRVRDSLTEGVSLFLAELQRMREIVDAARAGAQRRLFYLLDEMLHGTNTAERRIAARTVIEHLLEHGALGVVTTHDLSLADEPSIAANAVRVHFTEHVERDDAGVHMSFDYLLRPGLATSTNALTLLEIVGL